MYSNYNPDAVMNIQEEIVKWAEKYVPEFNKLSEKYNTSYYTQSPLNCIDGEVDLMIIGINPKGNLGEGSSKKTTEEYLAGNPYWSERFTKEGKTAWRYNHGARFFLGFDDFCHDESIDNDKKTVWTNLSPFESKNGNNDLRKELMEIGIKSTLELIGIIRPKRIILLGINAFEQLEKSQERQKIEYSKVFSNIKAQVGRINNIPTACLTHPSGQWEVSNKFNSMFVFLHELAEITNKKSDVKPLKEVVKIMHDEMKLWQDRAVL